MPGALRISGQDLAAFGQQAYAVVDVNTANEDALRTIKGIGPAKAKSILDNQP